MSRQGFPAPNPHVGCVIVRDGEIVGEGYHDHAGGDHAEVMALKVAGERSEGSDVYVTLEPCNHFGRTPPCSRALVDAGVRSVTYATSDPNPNAAGGGETLRQHGVEVSSGLLQSEAAEANCQFLFATKNERPLVCVKAAMSLDGRIALPSGESKWITGDVARKEGRRLRAELGAVLVGANTVINDDPMLNVRDESVVNQPVRIVLDLEGKLSGKEKVFIGEGQSAIHVVTQLTGTTADQLVAPVGAAGFDIPSLLRLLYQRGITGVLVEGGARTISSFFSARCVERLELFIAPKLLGDGPTWLQGLELSQLSDAPTVRIENFRPVGSAIGQSTDFRASGWLEWRN